jgi:MFS family permease
MARLRQVFDALSVTARNDDIRRAELAWGASVCAEWAHFVALGVFAYGHGGSTAVGIAGLMRLAPAGLIAPFAASLGDRFPRERFLLGVVLLGAAALAVSAAGAAMDDRVMVFAAASAVGVCSTLFRPALMSLLPSLARTARELIAANGATSTIESLGTLLGPLGAGVLVAFADVAVVFAASAAALVVSAALLVRVAVPGRVDRPASASGIGLLHGFTAIRDAPRGRLLVGLIAAQAFVRGCLNVLIVVAAFELLDGGGGTVGLLTAAIGAGGVIGAVLSSTLGSRRLARIFALSLFGWGIPILLVAPSTELIAALVLLAIVGASNSIEDVSGFTLLQRAIRDDALSGVLGLIWGAAMGALALGSIATPILVRDLGARTAFVLVGVLLPVLTVAGFRRMRALDDVAAPSRQQLLVDGVPMFVPLSLAAKERLATKLLPLEVPAGATIVRAGDVGDRFYLIDSGAVRIDLKGSEKQSGPGDYFGEIALVRDVPRTATVTAAIQTRLYALERSDFLAAVTGHALAEAAAHDVVDTRLAETGVHGHA